VTDAPAELQRRWLALWGRIGAGGDGRTVLELLTTLYREPSRYYHTLTHIGDCLTELDRERTRAHRPDEAELALWFHDAVYDPRAGDNEARSAELAERVLRDAGLADDSRERVAGMIRATTHAELPTENDMALVCDADLAILGASPERYARYVTQIRNEFAWVPAALFRQRRAAVLARFLDRAAIYASPRFRERYEARARQNLSAELLEL